MKKIRVYELAKRAGIESKDLILYLQRRGVNVTSPSSTIDEETVAKILGVKKPAPKQPQAAVPAPPAAETATEAAPTAKGAPAASSGAVAGVPAAPVEVEVPEGIPLEPVVEAPPQPAEAEKPAHEKAKEKAIEEEKERKREKEVEKEIAYPRKKTRKTEEEQPAIEVKRVVIDEGSTVGEFAEAIGRSPAEIIKTLMELGELLSITQPIPPDAASLIAESYGIELVFKSPLEEVEEPELEEEEETYPEEPRPPVVTVMGHVDHGKTTLLDAIRKTNVVATEAGGITQHIGAYTVQHNGKAVTFIDTPGHEAFTAMRARGAQITDIAVLVVAADDGVMPQTIEAMDHAKAAGVPIVVAINKIDKPDANPDRVKKELADRGLIPEEWGGDTVFVNVSAKTGQNIDELLEMLLLVAEMQDLKARRQGRARGVIIEAKLEKGRGPVATVLVKKGTLRVGAAVTCGLAYGRVRAMFNDKGEKIEEAGPGIPAEILGLSEPPAAGTELIEVADEKEARRIAEERALKARIAETMRRKRLSLEELFEKAKEGEAIELNLVLKADTQGSLEAVRKSLEELRVENVVVRIIHASVGGITEADVMLATASNAIVIGFNVRPDTKAKELAARETVEIRTYRVIYELVEDIEAALKGLLAPEFVEEELGQAEIRQVFRVPKVGSVAGCYVTSGRITRNAKVRLIRQGVIVYEGAIRSLRRFKEDVSEVKQGFECGIGLENFQDIKEGDIIEAYQIVEKARE